MARSRKVLTAGAVGVAALALIGAGASATFTTSTGSSQPITAGTINVVVSSPDAPGCTNVSNLCKELTFPTVAPVGSTFETVTHRVTITNVGDIPVADREMNLSTSTDGSDASAYLKAQTNVCIRSGDGTEPEALWVVANGSLTRGQSLSPSVLMNQGPTLELAANGGSDFYEVSFYAGKDSICGSTASAGTETGSAWGPYRTPPSLTNDAMGGSIIPKLSFNFEG